MFVDRGIDKIIDFVISHPTKPFMIDDRSMLGRTESLSKLWSLDYNLISTKARSRISNIQNPMILKKCFYGPASDFAIEQLLFLEYTNSWHLLRSQKFAQLYAMYLRKLRATFFLANAFDAGISYLKWNSKNPWTLPYLFNCAPIKLTTSIHSSYRAIKDG
jgi:hypothetical protein